MNQQYLKLKTLKYKFSQTVLSMTAISDVNVGCKCMFGLGQMTGLNALSTYTVLKKKQCYRFFCAKNILCIICFVMISVLKGKLLCVQFMNMSQTSISWHNLSIFKELNQQIFNFLWWTLIYIHATFCHKAADDKTLYIVYT